MEASQGLEIKYGMLKGIGECTDTEIVIPNSVTSIGKDAFKDCEKLKSVTIPDSVTIIGDNAFSGCGNVEKIVVEDGNKVYCSSGNCLIGIPSKKLIFGCKNSIIPTDGSVTIIGRRAFYDCYGLKEIFIPAGITTIESEAFAYCHDLTFVEIGKDVVSIGDSAFLCKNLTIVKYEGKLAEGSTNPLNIFSEWAKIDLPINLVKCLKSKTQKLELLANKLALIGSNSLSKDQTDIVKAYKKDLIVYTIENDKARALTELLKIGAKIKIDDLDKLIGQAVGHAEAEAVLLEYKKITYSAEDINANEQDKIDKAFGLKDYTFADWRKIFIINSCNGVVYISGYKGDDKSLFIPGTINGKPVCLDYRAFAGCNQLESIYISDGLIEIRHEVFEGCDNLKSIRIPNSIVQIGSYVFGGCNNLQYNEFFDANYLGNEENAYLVLVSAKDKTTITNCKVKEGCKIIAPSAFSWCKILNEIEIPIGVVSIGGYAFDECIKLKSIIIPNGITEINGGTFCKCRGLKTIALPTSIKEIHWLALEKCSKLESIIFNGSMTLWNLINKHEDWDQGTGNYVVNCTDGNISKS